MVSSIERFHCTYSCEVIQTVPCKVPIRHTCIPSTHTPPVMEDLCADVGPSAEQSDKATLSQSPDIADASSVESGCAHEQGGGEKGGRRVKVSRA